MAKLVYIGFPSPLVKAYCEEVDTGVSVEVEQISRGVCQDISVVPEKKGKYKLTLEFDYDPSTLSNLSSCTINGVTSVQQTRNVSAPTQQSAKSFDVNFPGMNIVPNPDGTISFTIPDKDGSNTEVSAMLPGMNVQKNDDGTVSFSIPSESSSVTDNIVTSSGNQNTNFTLPTTTTGSARMTKTTRTTTTTTTTGNTPISAGEMVIPRSSNINLKLPCPKQHQGSLMTSVTDPAGKSVRNSCTIVDDNMINIEFTPATGNGTYSLEIFIGDTPFPGSPIQLEVKGL